MPVASTHIPPTIAIPQQLYLWPYILPASICTTLQGKKQAVARSACSKRHAVSLIVCAVRLSVCLSCCLSCCLSFCLRLLGACRCGAVTDVSPYRHKLEDGVEVNKAWEQSKDEIDENSRYGTWKADYFLSKPDPAGRFCHATEIRSANSEAFWYQTPRTSKCIVPRSWHMGRNQTSRPAILLALGMTMKITNFSHSNFVINAAASTVTPMLHALPRVTDLCSMWSLCCYLSCDSPCFILECCVPVVHH